MSAINLEDWLAPISRGIIIKGMLLRDYDLATDLPLLDQDILEIVLPNGMKIGVGWFPENDPDGRFLIRVFRKYYTQMVRPPIEATSPHDVAAKVADLAREYGSSSSAPRTTTVSCSSTQSIHVVTPLGTP
jgi:hypothetical protein